MANLPSSASKMNDVETAQGAPVSEATIQKEGSNINYLLDNKWNSQTFLAGGSWVAPSQMPNTNIIIEAMGGGGGGGGGVGFHSVSGTNPGGGGGGGAAPIQRIISGIIPGNTYTISIGAGGVGGNGDPFGPGVSNSDGQAGGVTTISGIFASGFQTYTWIGGAGGERGLPDDRPGYGGKGNGVGGDGGQLVSSGRPVTAVGGGNGGNSPFAFGGAALGGGGGGAGLSNGGDSSYNNGVGQSGAANSGAGGGGGGGGAQANNANGNGSAGGNGGSGKMIIFWQGA